MTNQSALLKLALLLLMMHGTSAELTIVTKPDVPVGEELLVLCKSTEEGDITLQKDEEDIDDIEKIDEKTAQLHIQKATIEDTGTYVCLFESEAGAKRQAEKQVFVYEGPTFENIQSYHEFLEGKEGTMPCNVRGKPVVDVYWQKDETNIPSNAGGRVRQLSDNALHIENLTRQDAGMYVCSAQIKGRPVKKQIRISVVVNAPPKVHLKEKLKKATAGSETNISLECLVTGNPKPNITWNLPEQFDPSRHHYNSDRSQLTIRSVARTDHGEYWCTATNKLSEASAAITLHVSEPPEVYLSAEARSVSLGDHVSVSCNVSGYPQPELHWISKHSGLTLDSNSSRVHVVDGVLRIEKILPSDGGLYSCMAVGPSGNASRDVAIYTQPGPPHYLVVSPEGTSAVLTLITSPVTGGSQITSFVLQWKENGAKNWTETTVPATDPLNITHLQPYTEYTVRLAAINAVGLGQFSHSTQINTRGIREPDHPGLITGTPVTGNSICTPIKSRDNGETPLLQYNARYRLDTETAEWEEMQLPPDTNSICLKDLLYGKNYQMEVTAVNTNGTSAPAMFSFTTAPKPSSLTKGTVAGIVMLIFLVVFLVVDATCCLRNRCGLLMSIGVKLFGGKVPGVKMMEEGAVNGDMNLKGMSTPRGSLHNAGVQTLTKEGGLTEVTCDKAPLTKHEKIQPDRNINA